MNVLRADLNYLNSGTTSLGDLNKFMGLAFSMGPPHAKHELLKLKPDSTKGSTVKLVNEREKIHPCTQQGCTAMFAERKEVNRHIKRSHLEAVVASSGGNSGGGLPNALNCPHCTRSFKTPGWLDRHIKSNHGLAVPNVPNAPPPSLSGTENDSITGMVVGNTLVGPTPRRGRGGPVSSPGNGGVGRIGSRQSRRLRGLGGE